MTYKDKDADEELPEFHAVIARFLHCVPGNYGHADGEPATVITISRTDLIEPLVFPLADTREMVAKLLVSLATAEDEFAQKLLEDHFAADADGNFVWPRKPYKLW